VRTLRVYKGERTRENFEDLLEKMGLS